MVLIMTTTSKELEKEFESQLECPKEKLEKYITPLYDTNIQNNIPLLCKSYV